LSFTAEDGDGFEAVGLSLCILQLPVTV